jgi:hypothetical protein
MFRLSADDTLRQTLSDRGREQACLFSWEKAAQETLQVFHWAHAHHQAAHKEMPSRRARLDGVYLDGWATRRVRLDLPFYEEVRAIKLEGFSGYLTYPATIRMNLCGRAVGTQGLDRPGTFSMVWARRKTWMVPSRLSIELLANRDFIPQRVGFSEDFRRLAYLIERLALICRDGDEVPLYTRMLPPE